MTQQNNSKRQPAEPHPALKQLNTLIGEWEWEAVRDGSEIIGRGWARFEWLEGSTYLIEHSNTEAADFPTTTTAIIGLDDSSGQFTRLYADERGVYRVYQMRFQDSIWELWRDAPGFFQRFKGIFRKGGNTITAYWDFSEDGVSWKRDFNLVYKKVT